MSASTLPANATSMETKPRPWWMMLIEGIVLAGIGAILLFSPAQRQVNTWLFLVTVLGVWWIIRGVLDLVAMFMDPTAWGWKLFMGIISIVAGGYIVMNIGAAAILLPQIFVLVLGIWGLIQGIVMLIMAFRGGGWGAGILGVLAIIFGLILIGAYGDFGVGIAFVWSAAVLALIGGIVMIIQSFRTRNA